MSIYRSVVETWKIIRDNLDKATNQSNISLIKFYTGFQRDDSRSWLDFHDGISNMNSGEGRLQAITIDDIVEEEYKWAKNFTYMAFLRLPIDLTIWRNIGRKNQEILVGRDKLTGCPIVSIDESGKPVVLVGCPAPGTIDITDDQNKNFRSVDILLEKRLRQSHIARTHHSGNNLSGNEDSLRIFRQGYEFFENVSSAPFFRAGLNFISYQNTPKRLINLLTREGWLGRTNFGGDPDNPIDGSDKIISVSEAGFYFVPPSIEGELFPGARILI